MTRPLFEHDLDLKSFMDQHGIDPWPTEHDRIETALRIAGLKVLFVESLDRDRWRLAVIRQEPLYFDPDAATAIRLGAILMANGNMGDLSEVRLKKASFRLEATFTWPSGEPGRGISYGLTKRGRLVEHREEYLVKADSRAVALRPTRTRSR